MLPYNKVGLVQIEQTPTKIHRYFIEVEKGI